MDAESCRALVQAQPLSRSPQPLRTLGLRRLFSPPAVPPVLSPPEAQPPPPECVPIFPSLLSLHPSILPPLPQFRLHSRSLFSMLLFFPLPLHLSLPSHPLPPSDPPFPFSGPLPLQLCPNLFLFSSASRPVTSFLYLSPDSPCLSSPPTAPHSGPEIEAERLPLTRWSPCPWSAVDVEKFPRAFTGCSRHQP